MNAGGEEGFVGVDVAEAGEAGLVEEQVFYNSIAFKDLYKLFLCNFIGFRSEFG